MGKENNSKVHFMETLQELENGDIIFDASVKLQKVIEAVKEHNGKGSVTIKLEVSRLSKFGENAFNIVPTVSCTTPAKAYKNNVRFAGKENILQKDDPNQMQFSQLEKSFNQ